MYSVVLIGADTGPAIRMPDQSITVEGSIYRIDAEIDMLKERCTYRRVIIQNGTPLGQKAIQFKIALSNFFVESEKTGVYFPNLTKYPQKHTVDFKIYGANGANGFILDPKGTGDSLNAIKNAYANGLGPVLFAHSLAIKTDGSAYGDNGRSSLTWDWFVDEPEYVSHGLANYSRYPFNSSRPDEMYTRPNTPTDIVEQHGYGDAFRVRKGLSLLYSEMNIVVFRVTVEILSKDEKYLTVRKYTGGESLS
jgi:hypothetical protein